MQTRDFPQEWQDRSSTSLQSTRTTGTANKPLPHSAEVSTTQSPAHPSLLRVRTLSLHISKWTSIRPFTATHLACTAASADTGHSLVSPPRVTPLSRVPAQPCTHQGSWCPSPDPSAATTPPARTIQQPASCHLQQCMAKHRRYLLQCTLIHSFSPTTSARREAADPPPPFHCLAAMWNNGAPTYRRLFHPLQVRCGWPPGPPCGRPSAARGCQSWRP